MNLSRTEKDIVLSSRIRLARNIRGYNFSPSLPQQKMEDINTGLAEVIDTNPYFKDFTVFNINDLDELDRVVLKEKKIISERYYRNGGGIVVTDNLQQTSIVTGDLDHIRISSVQEGLNIDKALLRTLEIEKELSGRFEFASTKEDGYLTVNVSDSGMAVKGSVYLHLPVLSASDLMDHYIINTLESMLEVTGFSGGGAHSLGGFYIISNKNSFFPDEMFLAELLNKTAKEFIEQEREVREDLIEGKYPGLEDRIFRSLGIIKYCRQISELEAISVLSMIRLGISVNWIDDLTIDDITMVLGTIGNGYLRSLSYESKPDETEIMRLRAETIRDNLNLKS